MAEAGADILIPHMGLTTKGSIGAHTAKTLEQCVPIIDELAAAARSVRDDVIMLCHGGPIAEPDDARPRASVVSLLGRFLIILGGAFLRPLEREAEVDLDGCLFVVFDDRARIIDEGYDPVYGARPLKRVIQKQIIDPLAAKIIKGEIRDGDSVLVDAQDGVFTFEVVEPVGSGK